jgi:hypothetical protein
MFQERRLFPLWGVISLLEVEVHAHHFLGSFILVRTFIVHSIWINDFVHLGQVMLRANNWVSLGWCTLI